jgi:hypothetical protein
MNWVENRLDRPIDPSVGVGIREITPIVAKETV